MTTKRSTTLGYNQWVNFDIKNKSDSRLIKIANVALSYGKLYAGYGKDYEIPASQIENIVISPGAHYHIHSCGREWSPSGTTGFFDLFDETSRSHICRVNWDCPWGGKSNTLVTSTYDCNWSVEAIGFKFRNELGSGDIACTYNVK